MVWRAVITTAWLRIRIIAYRIGKDVKRTYMQAGEMQTKKKRLAVSRHKLFPGRLSEKQATTQFASPNLAGFRHVSLVHQMLSRQDNINSIWLNNISKEPCIIGMIDCMLSS